MRATFPAGSVSCAPKIRATQITSELEGRTTDGRKCKVALPAIAHSPADKVLLILGA